MTGYNHALLERGCVTPQARADASFRQEQVRMAPGHRPEQVEDPICTLQDRSLTVLEPSTGKAQLITMDASGCSVRMSTAASFKPGVGSAAVSVSPDLTMMLGCHSAGAASSAACFSFQMSPRGQIKVHEWQSQQAPQPLCHPSVVALHGNSNFFLCMGQHTSQIFNQQDFVVNLDHATKRATWRHLTRAQVSCLA